MTKNLFKSKNRHSNFSGYNLVGFDPLLFYSKYKQKEFSNPLEFLKSLPVITVVRVKTSQTPNLLFRYPSMCDQEKPSILYGWDISFGPYGLPLNLKPIAQKIAPNEKQIKILTFVEGPDKKPCRKLIVQKGNSFYPTEQLNTYLELIFDI